MPMPARIVFFGTPEIARFTLTALADSAGGEVCAVVTQPDRPRGRNLLPAASPVKEEALRREIPILQPERARQPEFIEQLRKLEPALIIVVAYGQILPPPILELPRFGCLNVHMSLLPKYRGAAPIQWVFLDDEAETGVTIMKMDAGLDTGDILVQRSTPILPEDDAQTLHDRLGRLGPALLLETLPGYFSGQITARPQPATGSSYARKIVKEDGLLDWRQSARDIWNRVRGLSPWPGAFTFRGSKRTRLKIWRAAVEPSLGSTGTPGRIVTADGTGIVVACGQQSLRILAVQPEGGRKLTPAEYLAGHPHQSEESFALPDS